MKQCVGREAENEATSELQAETSLSSSWSRAAQAPSASSAEPVDPAAGRGIFHSIGAAIARGQERRGRPSAQLAMSAPFQASSLALAPPAPSTSAPIQRLVLPDAEGVATPTDEAGVLQRLTINGDLEEGEYYLLVGNGDTLAMFEHTVEQEELIEYHFVDFWSGDEIVLNNTEEHANVMVNHIPEDMVDDIADEMVEEGEVVMHDVQNEGDDQPMAMEVQEDAPLPQIDAEALNFQFEGLNVGQILAGLQEQGDIGVIQAKFLKSNFNAPNDAWVIMTAPLGGGKAPGGNPPGWVGGAHPNHHQRGHLIGKQFGGGGGLNNLVTLTDGTNHPAMTIYENALAATVAGAGAQTFFYKVTPTYKGGFFKKNSGGVKIIQHPAPSKVTLYAKNLATGAVIYNNISINNGLLQNHKACVD